MKIFCFFPAAGAEVDLFVLKGASVHLDVPAYKGQEFKFITWKVNGSEEILEYIQKYKDLQIYKSYKNTAEFNNSTLSLLLKNVQLNHSGIYTAEIKDHEGNRHVTTHRLSVEEGPPKPQVGVTLLSSAGGLCIVSVNCSAGDFLVSHTCDHTHCTLAENTTLPSRFTLTVTATRSTIFCSSSNRADKKTQANSIEDICPLGNGDGMTVFIIITSVTCFICIFLISIIITVIYRRKRHTQGIHVVTKINTEYATVERLQNQRTMYDMVTTAKPERSLEVNTVYHTLGPPGDNSAKPETIYTTVNKSAA
ncbi:hypothetical protein GJAV_G00094050 [Gymnothorax javanicus]|nr:hypothetical protein GJAV_G00094050 [Gymnothorax javanicus]